jgi:replicative DNA helicase
MPTSERRTYVDLVIIDYLQLMSVTAAQKIG